VRARNRSDPEGDGGQDVCGELGVACARESDVLEATEGIVDEMASPVALLVVLNQPGFSRDPNS